MSQHGKRLAFTRRNKSRGFDLSHSCSRHYCDFPGRRNESVQRTGQGALGDRCIDLKSRKRSRRNREEKVARSDDWEGERSRESGVGSQESETYTPPHAPFIPPLPDSYGAFLPCWHVRRSWRIFSRFEQRSCLKTLHWLPIVRKP